MEFQPWLEYSLQYLDPAPPQDFIDYIKANPNLYEQYTDLLMYTLPSPRWKWYEPTNF